MWYLFMEMSSQGTFHGSWYTYDRVCMHKQNVVIWPQFSFEMKSQASLLMTFMYKYCLNVTMSHT